ncbi:MAG: triose-phosphate isomerase [Burkholderiales bacterium]|jgi:triosephosphate isomerase|nr:triose-phosphate isomerase [Burkholderiales bacterium]MCA3230219.1 triose-phosphate isomerase [Burkholderiales bacterium]
MRRKLIAANWKMNGSRTANAAWLASFDGSRAPCDVVVCAPFVYLPQVLAGLRAAEAGAQNLSAEAPGAHTGEVAGEMLLDLGVRWVIVGHSERRMLYGESSQVVAAKAARALALGLRPIVCVGETLAEREAGRTLEVIGAQLEAVLARCAPAQLLAGALAYEPVWAIGTGRTASPVQAQEVHAAIRAQVAHADAAAASQLRLLYGGSMKPANAAELLAQPDVDGGLIGGASLQAAEFAAICGAAG